MNKNGNENQCLWRDRTQRDWAAAASVGPRRSGTGSTACGPATDGIWKSAQTAQETLKTEKSLRYFAFKLTWIFKDDSPQSF